MTNVESMHTPRQAWAVILVGPPGSGKGTQADALAEKFGLYHLETSEVIEEKFANADPTDEVIARQLEVWKSGELMDPELIMMWVMEKMKTLADTGTGIVMSGSPRTVPEAQNEIPLLEKLYGRDNVKVVHLKLSKEESIRRNSKRRICKQKRHPIPDIPEYEHITACPKCGSELVTRELDTPETISVRYEVYLRRTQPILSYLSEAGYAPMVVDGEQTIDKVFHDILGGLGALDHHDND